MATVVSYQLQSVIPNTSQGKPVVLPLNTPLNDAGLINYLHEWLSALTGINAKYVRPRWQPEPPNLPVDGIDWLAFGIVKRESDTFASDTHFSDSDGYNIVRRQEVLHILVSCYGNNADNTMSMIREGMMLSQNREGLAFAGISVIGCDESTIIPELVKERWLYRVDLPFKLSRIIERKYPILNLLSAVVNIDSGGFNTNTIIKQ